MESTIKKLIDKLRGKNEMQLPPGADWESMRAGIYSKMKKEKRRPFFFWFNDSFLNKLNYKSIFLVCSFLIVSTILFDQFYQINKKQKSAEKIVQKNSTNENSIIDKNIVQSTKERNAKNIDKDGQGTAENKSQLNNISGQKITGVIKTKEQVTSNERMNVGTARNITLHTKATSTKYHNIPREIIINKMDSSQIKSHEKSRNLSKKEEELFSAVKPNIEENTKSVNIPEKSVNTRNNFIPESILFKTISLTNDPMKINELAFDQPLKKPSGKFWSMGILAGNSNTLKPNEMAYGLPSGVKVKEEPVMAPFVQANLKKRIGKNWSLSTGIEWQIYYSRFNYNSDRYELRHLKDTVILTVRNQITGKETQYYGDTSVYVRTRRNLVHYNSTNVINVPLSINWEQAIQKFSYTIGAGALINIFAQHKGRTYNAAGDAEVINFNKKHYFNNVGISMAANLGIGYQLFPKYKLTGGISYIQSFKNWRTDDSATPMRPKMYRIGLGIEYRL